MNEHDEFEHVAYVEAVFNGVVHRVPVTPEQARRWLEGEEAIGHLRGEPVVDEGGRLIELHGLRADQELRATDGRKRDKQDSPHEEP